MKERAISLMQEYFQEQSYIEHALAVTDFAEKIATGEKVSGAFMQQVITLAAIFHDVGIPAALKKHGSGAGPLQEAEGEPIARRLLEQLGARPDVRERVCYLVRHHHSPQFIDGLDFQILYEADALVNIPNRYEHGQLQDPAELEAVVAETFRTATGKTLIQRWSESI
ncbi:MAG: HD domain-containing protein [Firmicutes bacterium]|nr:HD domain-containing protein [Bacillota bacterium]